MKKFAAVYFLIFFLIIFDVNVVTGSEKWSVERPKILKKFFELNRKMKAMGDEIDKNKASINQNTNAIESAMTEIEKLEANCSLNARSLRCQR